MSLPQTNPNNSRSGQSGLQEIRRINKAKRAAEEAEREAEEQAARKEQERKERHRGKRRALVSGGQSLGLSGKKGNYVTPEGRSLVLSEGMKKVISAKDARMRASNEWVKRYRQKSTPQYIPQMTMWQRLWPSGLFTMSVVGLALIFAHLYTPPSPAARLFPNTPPAAATVGAIIALNVLVCCAWRLPPLWRMLNRQFMVVPAMPQAFSMLGAEFSHTEVTHLLGNMGGIWLLGTSCTSTVSCRNKTRSLLINVAGHDDIGRGPFIALVCCGAVVPSFVSMSAYVISKIFITATLGASGILCAMLGATCVLYEG